MLPEFLRDQEFLRLLAKKDEDAFAKLYYTVWPKLYAFIKWRLKEYKNYCIVDETAQDIAQDTFLAVSEKIHTFNPNKGAALITWIYKIAINKTTDCCRKILKEKDFFENVEEGILNPFSNGTLNDDGRLLLAEVMKAVSHLSEIDREYFFLMYENGFSNSIIAEMMGVPEGNVRTRRNRLHKKLRKLLKSPKDNMGN